MTLHVPKRDFLLASEQYSRNDGFVILFAYCRFSHLSRCAQLNKVLHNHSTIIIMVICYLHFYTSFGIENGTSSTSSYCSS